LWPSGFAFFRSWRASREGRWAVQSRHFETETILLGMEWYLRYSLSYRDIQQPSQRPRVFLAAESSALTILFCWVTANAVILPPVAGRDFMVSWTPAFAGVTFSTHQDGTLVQPGEKACAVSGGNTANLLAVPAGQEDLNIWPGDAIKPLVLGTRATSCPGHPECTGCLKRLPIYAQLY